MAITPTQPTPGLAQYESDTIGALVELWAGDTPAPVTISGKYSATLEAAGIPANTPVSLDYETGAIALVDGTTVTKANAITVGTLLPRAGGSGGEMAVYKAGCVNIKALNWPASFDTDAKKLAAFDLAECQIYVKVPYYS